MGIFFLLLRRRRQQEHGTQPAPPVCTGDSELPADMQQPRTDRFGNPITWGNRRRYELGETTDGFSGAEIKGRLSVALSEKRREEKRSKVK
jgi:hypothetical protein